MQAERGDRSDWTDTHGRRRCSSGLERSLRGSDSSCFLSVLSTSNNQVSTYSTKDLRNPLPVPSRSHLTLNGSDLASPHAEFLEPASEWPTEMPNNAKRLPGHPLQTIADALHTIRTYDRVVELGRASTSVGCGLEAPASQARLDLRSRTAYREDLLTRSAPPFLLTPPPPPFYPRHGAPASGAMASTSSKVYIIEGLKISLDVLQDISDVLPAPMKTVVSLVQRIVIQTEVRRRRAARRRCLTEHDFAGDPIEQGGLRVTSEAPSSIAPGRSHDDERAVDSERRRVHHS